MTTYVAAGLGVVMRTHLRRVAQLGRLAAMAFLPSISSQALSAPNLVTNGDFQTGDLSGWNTQPNYRWSVGYNVIHDSLVASGLADLGYQGHLSQSLALNTGSRYRVSFDYSGGYIYGTAATVRVGDNIIGRPFSWGVGKSEFSSYFTAGDNTILDINVDSTGSIFNLDNVSVVEVNKPRTFGLFVGVADHPENSSAANDFRGDLSAQGLAEAFSQFTGTQALSITADRRNGDGITKQEIDNALELIRQQATPDDTIFIYMAGHGGSNLSRQFGPGAGDEYINLNAPGSGDESFDDGWLADQLRGLSDIQKLVFLESCHGGGFWGSGDLLENYNPFHPGDIDTVSNTALIASSVEKSVAYYDDDGWGLTSKALLDVLQHQPGVSFSGTALYDAVYRSFLDHTYRGQPVFEMEFGDAALLDPESASISGFGLQNFNGAVSSAVPEPETWYLLWTGFLAVGFVLRRSQDQQATL